MSGREVRVVERNGVVRYVEQAERAHLGKGNTFGAMCQLVEDFKAAGVPSRAHLSIRYDKITRGGGGYSVNALWMEQGPDS